MVWLNENKIIFEEKSSKGINFIEGVFSLIRAYIESFLELEFEEMRKGYKKKGIRQRNGYYERSLVTEFGLIKDIHVPLHNFKNFIEFSHTRIIFSIK